jgi:hypothetical protein
MRRRGCSPVSPTTLQHGSNGLWAIGVGGFRASVDDGPDVELSPTPSLREELAGVRRAALSVRRLRRGRGDEFLETRIVPKRIEHWIQPE